MLTRLTNWRLHQRDRRWGHDGHMVCVSDEETSCKGIVIQDTPDCVGGKYSLGYGLSLHSLLDLLPTRPRISKR